MDYDVKGHLHQILDTLPQGVRLVGGRLRGRTTGVW